MAFHGVWCKPPKTILTGIKISRGSMINLFMYLIFSEEKLNLKKKKCKDKKEMDEIIFPQGKPMQLITGIENRQMMLDQHCSF